MDFHPYTPQDTSLAYYLIYALGKVRHQPCSFEHNNYEYCSVHQNTNNCGHSNQRNNTDRYETPVLVSLKFRQYIINRYGREVSQPINNRLPCKYLLHIE